jgi:uncharacterized protein
MALSQRYWFAWVWKLVGRAHNPSARHALQALWIAHFALLVFVVIFTPAVGPRTLLMHHPLMTAWTGLWLTSALFAFLAVKAVDAAAWFYGWFYSQFYRRFYSRLYRPLYNWSSGIAHGSRPASRERFARSAPGIPPRLAELETQPVNPARRHFVQAATIAAAAMPFTVAAYGSAFERFHYRIHKVDLPVPNLPAALAGLRIAQLSDIHIGTYMSATQVRRAVDMANALLPDLTVVTGDFLTAENDPLEACIAELSRLCAPLGVWGCNGNHEIYAGVEALSAELFEHYGMRLLRQDRAELVWHGQSFNLIGVDYQRERDINGVRHPMLAAIEPLVRRDVPNILLSHNPNSFRRAAELGIELTLAGHTHGGQVNVEILDHHLSVARFLTPYVAGMYLRPLGASAHLNDRLTDDDDNDDAFVPPHAPAGTLTPGSLAPAPPHAVLYVNRGLGTIGMPVRINVPPEITLHTLRRA